eukprot:gene19563-25018_t
MTPRFTREGRGRAAGGQGDRQADGDAGAVGHRVEKVALSPKPHRRLQDLDPDPGPLKNASPSGADALWQKPG